MGFQSPNSSSRKATPPSITRPAVEGRRLSGISNQLSVRSLNGFTRHANLPLLGAGGQGFVGGAKERSGFVEDDGDGDIAEDAFEFPFVLEGVEENSVFHFFENLDGNAAGDVDAYKRQNFQREIPSFGTIDGGPEIQGVRTDAAGFVQSATGNFRGRIGVGIVERRMDYFRRKKFMKGAEAAAGKNELPANLRIAATHEAEEFDLLLGVRREIGMATFRRHNAIATTIPN